MSLEIKRATTAIPVMVLLTIPFFLLELNGYSFLYLDINECTGGYKAILWQILNSFFSPIVVFISFIDGYTGHLFTKCYINLITSGLFVLHLLLMLSIQLMGSSNLYLTIFTHYYSHCIKYCTCFVHFC